MRTHRSKTTVGLAITLAACLCGLTGDEARSQPLDVNDLQVPNGAAGGLNGEQQLLRQLLVARPEPAQVQQQAIAPGRRVRRQVRGLRGNNILLGNVAAAGNTFVGRPAATGEAIHLPFEPPITARKVGQAIDDATYFLRTQQAPDGSIGEGGWGGSGGSTALATLALLAAGGNPASDPALQRAIEWLLKLKPENTYVRGIRANVWEYALRKVPYDGRLRKALRKDFDWLLEALGDNDGWRYGMGARDWDNSCTQYGVLGIWAGERAGLQAGPKFWARMSKHFRSVQNEDGGWGYMKGGSTANMATAGLASMFLVFDMHHGKSFYAANKPRSFDSGPAAEVLAAVERGMSWLERSKDNRAQAYYLYGIERTGVASGRKRIGGSDWFADGALEVLRRQNPDGSVNMGYSSVISTSLCTLFLVYGGAPVVFHKLEYGQGEDWNLNPRDLANLSKYLWSAYERPVNWQAVHVDADVEEFEAPVLFISGSKAASFSEAQVARLKAYIERGGTILAEPSDHSAEFRQSMVDLVARMYPVDDYPDVRLEPLPAEHGVFAVLRQPWQERPSLLGAGDGARTFFFLSEGYLSADWQMNQVESEAFQLAMNLLFYATDMATPRGRFASDLPDDSPQECGGAVRVAGLQVGRVGPHPMDWDAAASTWAHATPYLAHQAGVDLRELDPVDLHDGVPEGVDLLHLCGRRDFRLDPQEQEALATWLRQGGTLLVDAWGGSEEFADAARRELAAAGVDLAPYESEDATIVGRFPGGSDLRTRMRFKLPARRLLRRRGVTPQRHQLETARFEGGGVVHFSGFDLSAAVAGVPVYGALGYHPDSARRVLTNVLASLSSAK